MGKWGWGDGGPHQASNMVRRQLATGLGIGRLLPGSRTPPPLSGFTVVGLGSHGRLSDLVGALDVEHDCGHIEPPLCVGLKTPMGDLAPTPTSCVAMRANTARYAVAGRRRQRVTSSLVLGKRMLQG